MAWVIGPTGVKTRVSDDVARSLVGDGEGDFHYTEAPSPQPLEAPKATPKKRAPRRTTKPKEVTE